MNREMNGKTMWRAGSLLAAVGVLTATGCPWGAGPASEESSIEISVVGGTAEQAVFAKSRYFDPLAGLTWLDILSGGFDPNTFEYEPPETEFVRVNLRTLETEALGGEIGPDSYSTRTDGAWLAWRGSEQEGVRVVNLDSGEESTYFADRTDGAIIDVAAVRNPYLVLEAGPTLYATTALVVINLETDERLFISPAFLVDSYGAYGSGLGSVSVAGDRLTMHVWPTLESAEDLDNPLTGRIEIVDLTSGERSTLAENVGGNGGELLLLEADRLLLLSSPYDGPTTVRGFPLDGGDPRTLMQFTRVLGGSDWQSIETFNAHGVLTLTSEYDGFFLGSRESYSVRTFDGEITPIYSYTLKPLSFSELTNPQSDPRVLLVDEFAVYRDRQQRDFVVYDFTTQTERRFEPFEP